MKRIWVLPLISLFALAGCNDDSKTQKPAEMAKKTVQEQQPMPTLNADFATVSRGARLYQQNCAQCHGDKGQGAPNWRQRDADGFYPAPPLNGTGHAWHHPEAMLKHQIKNGARQGMGKMPAMGDKLSDEEIDAIVTWFQSQWPQQVYAAWHRMDQQAQQSR